MTRTKYAVAAALAACALLPGGCGMLDQKSWEPQESDAILVGEDGTITEYVHEKLDEAYYDAAELQNMITSEVNEYNSAHTAESVTVKEFGTEGQEVSLELVYASAEDFAAFNNVEFYYGSLINAQLSGYLFDVDYKKVINGVVQGSAFSGSEVIKEMDKEVMVVEAPLEVKVPGNVLYTSANADVLASDVVDANGEADQKEEELVLPSNAVYRGEEKSFEEKAAANRVYIIFEKSY